ncbi:MAG: hypothetical protein JNK79_08105 [Chitinophagaceae bacterium]|nr:hypothetical protein [Chitinophagaceae bacterium]
MLLLIISETTTDALVGDDFSITACFIMVSTLVGIDLLFTLLKVKWNWLEKLTDGSPLIIVDRGTLLEKDGSISIIPNRSTDAE